MSVVIRRLPGIFGRALTGLLFAHRTMGAMVLDAEEEIPLLLANNLPDPRLELAGAIAYLFAGSLTMLLLGYVVDTTRALHRTN